MKKVVIIVPKGKPNLSSISGTYEILTRANLYWQRLGRKPVMEITLAGLETELKLDGGLFSLHPRSLRDVGVADLLILPSLNYNYEKVLEENASLVKWIRSQYQDGAEIASICTGAFLLAATGLLDGKICSTHWNAANDFRKMFPKVEMREDQLITSGKGLYTNGGAYSFLNLVLFLIEKYFDRATAIYCSKIFQIDIERDSQSPFVVFQAQKKHGDEMIEHAQVFIEKNLSKKISFETLAGKLSVSRRNFDRRFIKATGNTPVEYLQRVKVEMAKSILEKGRKNVNEVMDEVGYSDEKAFREVFKKYAGLSPFDYRVRYARG